MGRMKKLIASIATLVLVPLLLVPATVWVEQLMLSHGWASPEWLAAALQWGRAVIEHPVFAVVLTAAVSFAAGLLADDLALRFDGRHPMTRAGRLRQLAPELSSLAYDFDLYLRGRDEPTVPPNYWGKLFVARAKLERNGIVLPKSEHEMSAADYLRYASVIFHLIAPMLDAGEVDAAKAAVRSSYTWRPPKAER